MMNTARSPRTDFPTLSPRALPLLACLVGLLTAVPQPAQGVVVYETGFDSLTPDFSLTGQDGWQDFNATNAQGVWQYLGDTTNYASLGYEAPDTTDDGAYVFRPLNVDPVASGRPIVRFGVAFLIVDSTNGNYDLFSWSFYNQAADLLGSIDFQLTDTQTLDIYRDDGINSSNAINTTDTLTMGTWYELDVLADFERNTWDAYIYDYDTDSWITLFTDEEFHAGTSDMNLGDIDAVWFTGASPGDNEMLFDDYSVRMLDRREAWYVYEYDLFEEEIAAVQDLDDDGDGLSRDAEYAFGTNPSISDAYLAPFPAGVSTTGPNSFLTMSFDRRTGDYLGITYEVEEAGALSPGTVWTPLPLPANEIGTTPLLGFWEVAEVRGDRKISGPGAVSRSFLRVRIVPDP